MITLCLPRSKDISQSAHRIPPNTPNTRQSLVKIPNISQICQILVTRSLATLFLVHSSLTRSDSPECYSFSLGMTPANATHIRHSLVSTLPSVTPECNPLCKSCSGKRDSCSQMIDFSVRYYEFGPLFIHTRTSTDTVLSPTSMKWESYEATVSSVRPSDRRMSYFVPMISSEV